MDSDGASKLFFDAIANRNYLVAAVVAVIFFVFLLRKLGGKIPWGIGTWLTGDQGSSALALATGIATTLTAALVAGQPFTLQLLINCCIGGGLLGGAASGLRDHAWNIAKPADKTAAKPDITPPITILLLFFLLPLSVAGCAGWLRTKYCADPANANTARCKAEIIVTDCALPEVWKIAKSIAADVAKAVFGGNFTADMDAILQNVKTQMQGTGLIDAWGILTCALDEATKATPGTVAAVRYDHVEQWKKNHPAKTKPRQ